MPTQERLSPHQPPLIMLHAHRSLRILKAKGVSIISKQLLVLQIRQCDHNRLIWLALEAQLTTPFHVLDGEECAIGDDDEVEIGVGYQDSVCSFDDFWEDVLDWVE